MGPVRAFVAPRVCRSHGFLHGFGFADNPH